MIYRFEGKHCFARARDLAERLYPYEIEYYNGADRSETLETVTLWCIEQFGPEASNFNANSPKKKLAEAIDTRALWVQIGSAYRFRAKSDAAAFKVRWW